jgi:hypothetical protein
LASSKKAMVTSTMVSSVAAQKYNGDSVQPIGKTRGMATTGSSPLGCGSKQASHTAWSGFCSIRLIGRTFPVD